VAIYGVGGFKRGQDFFLDFYAAAALWGKWTFGGIKNVKF